MNMLFDIILPTCDNRDELLACLQGFEHQTLTSFRLLICIDGSNDGTHEMLEHYIPSSKMNIVILEHPDRKNHGRNATRNLALDYISADYVMCLDTDAIPTPNIVEEHLFIQKKEKCISAGDLTYVNANENKWAAYLHTRGKKRYLSGDEIPFQYITTGNVCMPSSWFKEVGGQDSKMRTYGGGDTEFAYRLQKRYGMKCYYAKNAIAYSTMNKSLRFALDQMQQFGAINLRYIRNKHPEFTQLFRIGELLGPTFSSRLMRFALHPIFGYFSEALAELLPTNIAIHLIAHAVGSRILKGYATGIDPLNQ